MSEQNMDDITFSYRKNLLKEIDDLLGEQLTDFVVNNHQWLQQITDVCCATYYRALLSNNDEINQIDEYFSGRFDTLKALLKLTDQKITQDDHSLFSYIFINNKCRDYKYNCGFALRAEKGIKMIILEHIHQLQCLLEIKLYSKKHNIILNRKIIGLLVRKN
jgi:hypothetical protein